MMPGEKSLDESQMLQDESISPMIRPKLFNNRWTWYLQGLPSLARARAMFLARRYTMTTAVRCRTLWDLCNKVTADGRDGAFVECGVWRGGSAAIMGLAAQHSGVPRKLHLFDSFEGLPEPTGVDGASAASYSGGRTSGNLKPIDQCVANRSEVEGFLHDTVGLDRENTIFHQGWFQNTVPADAPRLGPIAVLRLDGDWYDSTRICLEHLFPFLVSGGILILDDYFAWEGCAKATNEYRTRHNIETPITRIDVDCAYWIKEG
jgi:O-methyltransferase